MNAGLVVKWLTPILMAGLHTAIAMAHPVVIHTGSAQWAGNEFRIQLTFDLHSLQHETANGLLTNKQAASRLARSIEVHAHEGGLLQAVKITANEKGTSAAAEFKIPNNVTAIALVHRPRGNMTPIPRQFQIQYGTPVTQWVRLTTGGNQVIVLRDDQADAVTLTGSRSQPQISIIASHGSTIRVLVDFPCSLLATWPDLFELPGQTLTAAGFAKRSRDRIAEWARRSINLCYIDGECERVRNLTVILVDALGRPIPDADGEYSSLTTRVRAQAIIETQTPTELSWNGFNAAVLRMPWTVRNANGNIRRGYLTPTQPALDITANLQTKR